MLPSSRSEGPVHPSAPGPLVAQKGVPAPFPRIVGVNDRKPARSAVRWCITSALIAAVGLPAFAAVETSNVLVLYSNGRLIPANVEGDRGLHENVRSTADRPVALFYEFLDTPRFGGPEFEETVAAYLRDKYAPLPPRVVVAIGAQALDFLLRHRDALFPRVPVVHAAVERVLLRAREPLPAGVVGVPVDYDWTPTIDLALRWHPRARRLVIVTGASAADREFEAKLRQDTAGFAGRAEAEFLMGLPMGEVLERLRGLGGDAVVVTPGTFRDGEGRDFTPARSVELMAATSAAPVYGGFDTQLGKGIVGGMMPSFEAIGRQTGEIVNELLAGADAASLRLPGVTPRSLHLDWRQIRRWGIDEKAIPRDAVVHFRPPTLLEVYRDEVLIALAVFALQAGLIGWLLVERRRRRLAEAAEQSRRLELAHASRLAVAGELTGSIAHEINQPLGAILSNADAAELMLSSGGDRRDELRAILADIRRDDLRASEVIRRLRTLLGKHEVERRPFELNDAVREINSVLGAEARRRRLTLEIRPAPVSVTVVGDRIEVQQVIMNLVLNAMDAVADVPDDRRTVVVSVEKVARDVDVAVRDRGRGIAAEHLPKLFDAFFTTKRGGMGLGLSIARTIAEAHGGRVWTEGAPGGGAVFHFELPVAGQGDTRPAGEA